MLMTFRARKNEREVSPIHGRSGDRFVPFEEPEASTWTAKGDFAEARGFGGESSRRYGSPRRELLGAKTFDHFFASDRDANCLSAREIHARVPRRNSRESDARMPPPSTRGVTRGGRFCTYCKRGIETEKRVCHL